MPSSQSVKNRARFAADRARVLGSEALERVITPRKLKDKADAATRTGQIVALFLLGPFIVVSLQLIVVLNQLMTDLLGVQPLGGGQDPIFAWLVTAITGGAFLLAAWAWFQYVRTAGFGVFLLED